MSLNMKIPAQLADHMKVFERMVAPIKAQQEKMWQQYRGDFPTDQEQKKYDDLNERVEVIKEMQRLTYLTISIAGVTGEFGEDFLKAMKGEGDKEIEIKRLIEKAEKLYGYVKI